MLTEWLVFWKVRLPKGVTTRVVALLHAPLKGRCSGQTTLLVFHSGGTYNCKEALAGGRRLPEELLPEGASTSRTAENR